MKRHSSLRAFGRPGRRIGGHGPAAIILAEDESELGSTVAHHRAAGFGTIIVIADPHLPDGAAGAALEAGADHWIMHALPDRAAAAEAINRACQYLRGRWVYYCYNAEYLFYPFSETRRVGEMLDFHTEEKRDAMLAYVVDLYPERLADHPGGVSRETAMLDRMGYYALARPDPAARGRLKERQLDFHGGLRWRFEEHIPPSARRIDRIALFRARPELVLRADFTFDDEEYNTYACPWHHNLTAAICSFRTAKALCRNPGSREAIRDFSWHGSDRFTWRARQLLDLGLIEPGQWF
ncbi:glycosyltransferase family 2 protein [Profundibacterium mesophilum]|uniref:Glycosyl transferase family 2domain containing protein n=1 Tax=Profundibacterium mesophilum KAUST100406-0324 TaxID=1037889 RepID=A0A921NQC0_9RHOB|nr:glycosyltransferase family 2 protein [Profundibacterium mesophilum]KAF0676237.1 Glycosyl transferase family 2domain containing protein [Profundibacterium mesophilum KAUST100406-0324]